MNDLLILNYHSIYQSDIEIPADKVYSVEASSFRKQMAFIRQMGWKVVTVDEIPFLTPENRLSVAITFDDANESDCQITVSILNEFGFKATFFLPADNVMDEKRMHKYLLLVEKGHCIGPHGVTHRYLTDLNPQEQINEIERSKAFIEEKTELNVDYFALPGGKYSQETIKIAKKAGLKGLLTTHFGFVDLKSPSFLLNRYTVKNRTSFEKFQKVLQQNRLTILSERSKSTLKKIVYLFLSNQLIDKINYKLNG